MTIWVLQVCHRFGSDVWAAESKAAARAALYDYVKEWWSDANARQPKLPEEAPKKQDEAIEQYFDAMADGENYDITETDLLPANYGQT